MRRFGKAFICVLLAGILFFCQTGCTYTVSSSDTEKKEVQKLAWGELTDMTRKALELAGADLEQFDPQNPKLSEKMLIESAAYLETVLTGKYPETQFVVLSCVRRGLNQEYDEFRLAPSDRPEDVFMARVSGNTGNFSCAEGYYGVIHAEEYEQLLTQIFAEHAEQVQVFSTIDYLFSEEIAEDTPLAAAIREPDFYAFSWVLLTPNDTPFAERVSVMKLAVEDASAWGDYAFYLLMPDVDDMTKAEAFSRFPHNEEEKVYSDMIRYSLR